MALDIEEQYEQIYRYCFYWLPSREKAEDITQRTFLRWFASYTYRDTNQVLQYLYTIARNLCTDEYRKSVSEPCSVEPSCQDTDPPLSIALRTELDKLDAEGRELILLRYVNKVPIKVLCGLYKQSRFSLHRRMKRILKVLREALD